MGELSHLSNSAVLIERGDLEIVLRALVAFQQASSEAAEIILRRLDNTDGDPDAETGNDVEDDFYLTSDTIERAMHDPRVDCIDHDAGAYVEWHTMRGNQKRGPMLLASHEDDEDDDPAGQYDEDCYTGPKPKGYGPGCVISDPDAEHDGREDQEELTPDYGIDQTKSLPDAMVITSDRNAMRVHRDRIRNEACDKFTRYGVTDYRLR